MAARKLEVKRTVNTDKFRERAIFFEKYGMYTTAVKGTSEYKQFWDTEIEHCIEGYTAEDGDYIPGYFYFYLNYSIITLIKEVEEENKYGIKVIKTVETKSFPRFYDYDRAFFEAVDYAETNGEHLCVLKARRRGYSFKCGSMLNRNYFLIPGSKSYAIASETEFLTRDGILTKAWDMMDFIDENTAWTKKRQKVNTKLHKRSSFSSDINGTDVEMGYKSEVIGVSLKNDPQKARGKAGKLVLFEEAGNFKNLKTAWEITLHSVNQDVLVRGLMIAFGTGGTDDADYEGLKDIFYNPIAYKCSEFENEWDDGATESCGFFVPCYANMEGRNEDGEPFMDKDGNSNIELSRKYHYEEREVLEKTSADKSAIDRRIAELPMNPMEATLQISTNIFPKKDLIQHLAYIRNNRKIADYKQVGELVYDENNVIIWKQNDKLKDLTKYRLNKKDPTDGAIVIWEHPADNPPYGLYIAGCLLPGEKVLTNEGLLNVEDINYTNRLVDKDGDLVNIKALLRYDKENEDTYSLKLSNTYRTTTFTKEHPIYVSDHSLNKQNLIEEDLFKFDFKKVSELKTGDWIKYPNTYLDDSGWKKECNNYTLRENYWWFTGLWLGDGWCSKNRIYICFDKTNITQIERLKWFIKTYYEKDITTRERNGSIECSFSCDMLIKDLNKFGRYASGKVIPEHIKYEEDVIKKNILLGFLDSDGCVYKDKGGYISLEFVSMNLKLLEDFQDLSFSLGLVGNLSKLRDEGEYNIEGRIGKQQKAYHLRFGHTDSIKFANMCNFDNRTKLSKIDKNDIKQIRRRPKSGCFLSKDNKYIYFQIKDITKGSYTGVVYNFETKTHSFCTHHISTHNCDPYDHDKSGTNSLGSVIIYKRFQTFESYYDLPVAEYSGRPETADEFYENVKRLLMYYNARLLYENERKGLFAYFANQHCEYLLLDQPDLISDIIKNSSVQRRKGIHMVQPIKDHAERLVRDWLNEEYAPDKKNYTKIMSEALLEELIFYEDKGNYDRVIAFMMVMLYRQELYNTKVREYKEINRSKMIFDNILDFNKRT